MSLLLRIVLPEKLKEALHEPPSGGQNQGKVRVPTSFGVSPSKLRLQGIASHEDVITCWKIAKQGDKAAQECLEQMAPNFKRFLGSSLFHGHGVSGNKEEGVIWYWKACKQDDAQACDVDERAGARAISASSQLIEADFYKFG